MLFLVALGLTAQGLLGIRPAASTGLTITSLSIGGRHGLMTKSDGSVWGWGENGFGQVGNGAEGWNSTTPVQVTGVPAATAVAAGDDFSVILGTDNSIWVWGNNPFGQVGVAPDPTNPVKDVVTPTRVASLPPISSVAAGRDHVVLLGTSGNVWAFGRNADAQLGDGTTNDSAVPIQVPGLTGIQQVGAGGGYSFAIDAAGGFFAWGDNGSGQLGDVTTGRKTAPAKINGICPVRSASAGAAHVVAVCTDGTAMAWGHNGFGQVGNGAIAPTAAPQQVPGLTGVIGAAAGSGHSVVAKSDGTALAWGRNDAGQTGGTVEQHSPVQISGLPQGVSLVAAGGNSSMALTNSGLYGLGDNSAGQLATGATISRTVPTAATTATGLSPGPLPDRPANVYGDPKDGGAVVHWSPVWPGIAGLPIRSYTVTATPGGATRTVSGDMIDASMTGLVNGTSYTFTVVATTRTGSSAVSAPSAPVVPASVPSAPTAPSAVAASPKSATISWTAPPSPFNPLQSFIVESVPDGIRTTVPQPSLSATVSGLTIGKSYQFRISATNGIGTGAWSTLSSPVSLALAPESVAAGRFHSVATRADNSVWAWGWDTSGELCDGQSVGQSTTPKRIPGLSNVAIAAAGARHSLFLMKDGTVQGCGDDGYGQITGHGSIQGGYLRTSPTTVPGVAGATAVCGGGDFSAALLQDSTVMTWGSNMDGELGDPTILQVSDHPGTVPNLSHVTAIACGKHFIIATKDDGTVWAWGDNSQGQLGSPPNPAAPGRTPTPVAFPPTVAARSCPPAGCQPAPTAPHAVAAGDAFSAIIDANNDLWTWGANDKGQLGIGSISANNFLPSRPFKSGSGAIQPAGGSIQSIVAGGDFAISTDNSDQIWAWGNNSNGQLGTTVNLGAAQPTPKTPSGSHTTNGAFAAGGAHSLINHGANLETAGANGFGQLGNGTTTDTSAFGSVAWVPDAPSQPSAAPADSAATVTWQAPANDGGSPITSYTVVSSPDGIRQSVPAGSRTATFSGLVAGTDYTFTVTAINAVGTGIISAPSSPVTPTAPARTGFGGAPASPPTYGSTDWETAQFVPSCAQPGSRYPCNSTISAHGGNTMIHPRLYLIYWGSQDYWNAHGDLMDATNIFGASLNGTAYQNIITQYCGGDGQCVQPDAIRAGTFIDNSPFPANITETDIGNIIGHASGVLGWPFDPRNNAYLVIVGSHPGTGVIPPPNTASNFCAFHRISQNGANAYRYGFIDDPVGRAPYGCNADGLVNAVSTFTSHEYVEMATDPDANANFTPGGLEVGDLCQYNGVPALGAFVQYVWDRAANACVAMRSPTYRTSFRAVQYPLAGPFELANGHAYSAALEMKNDGNVPWAVGGIVRLGTMDNNNNEYISDFCDSSWQPLGWGRYSCKRILITRNVDSSNPAAPVLPGQRARWEFTFTPRYGLGPGVYREYFNVVAEQRAWMLDHTGLYISATVGSWHASVVSASGPSQPTLPTGLPSSVSATFRNTGSAQWFAASIAKLGTTGPRDRQSSFCDTSKWESCSRVGLAQAQVDPGGTYQWNFNLVERQGYKGTSSPTECFGPVAEYQAWMDEAPACMAFTAVPSPI